MIWIVPLLVGGLIGITYGWWCLHRQVNALQMQIDRLSALISAHPDLPPDDPTIRTWCADDRIQAAQERAQQRQSARIARSIRSQQYS